MANECINIWPLSIKETSCDIELRTSGRESRECSSLDRTLTHYYSFQVLSLENQKLVE